MEQLNVEDIDRPSFSKVKAEIIQLIFWKSLLLAVLWSAGGALFVFIAGHVWRWNGGPHELISFIILPIPVALTSGFKCGCVASLHAWILQSRSSLNRVVLQVEFVW